MDHELKERLDQIEKNMATKDDISRLERKNDKDHKGLLDYIEHIDTELAEHRRNSEVHKPVYS